MAYWDTSCLIKLYAFEADSADFQAHALAGSSVVTSEITRLELHAAPQRKEAARDLQVGGARQLLRVFDSDVANGLILVKALAPAVAAQFDAIIEQCYRQTPVLPLRTLDGIHIATAVDAGESEFVATDKRLRDAALKLGFTLYPIP
jgi:predicted nucleic acid-binding protein